MRSFRGLGLVVIIALAIGAIVTGAAAQSGYNGYNGYNGPGGNQGKRPTLKLKVTKNKPRVVLRRGVKVRATCNLPCVVKVRAFKRSKTFGTRSKRFPRRKGAMFVKLNRGGKKQLRRAVRAKKTFRFKVSGNATDQAGRRSGAARATAKVKAGKVRRKRG